MILFTYITEISMIFITRDLYTVLEKIHDYCVGISFHCFERRKHLELKFLSFSFFILLFTVYPKELIIQDTFFLLVSHIYTPSIVKPIPFMVLSG